MKVLYRIMLQTPLQQCLTYTIYTTIYMAWICLSTMHISNQNKQKRPHQLKVSFVSFHFNRTWPCQTPLASQIALQRLHFHPGQPATHCEKDWQGLGKQCKFKKGSLAPATLNPRMVWEPTISCILMHWPAPAASLKASLPFGFHPGRDGWVHGGATLKLLPVCHSCCTSASFKTASSFSSLQHWHASFASVTVLMACHRPAFRLLTAWLWRVAKRACISASTLCRWIQASSRMRSWH